MTATVRMAAGEELSIAVVILSGSVNQGAWSAPSTSSSRAPGMGHDVPAACTGMGSRGHG